MKIGLQIRNAMAMASVAGALLDVSTGKAAQLNFHVDVNTQSLVGNPNAPFYVDFQLIYGSGPFGNSAAINNFNFSGGSANGLPSLTGTAAGSLGTSVTLSDSGSGRFLNEFYQGFTPGSSLSFDVSLTLNTTILTPDGFSFAILDYSTGQIPTTDPNSGLSLVTAGITGPTQGLNSVQAFAGVNDQVLGDYSGVTVSVQPVPEPATTTIIMLAGVGMIAGSIFSIRKPVQSAA